MKSISASGHKFSLAPLGCGWVIWRDEEALPQNWCSTLTTLGGQIGTFAINFSRPAGQGNSTVIMEFLRLGREGYTKYRERLLPGCPLIWRDEIAKLGVRMSSSGTGRPDEGILAVLLQTEDGEDPGYTHVRPSLNVCVCAAGGFRPSLSAVVSHRHRGDAHYVSSRLRNGLC